MGAKDQTFMFRMFWFDHGIFIYKPECLEYLIVAEMERQAKNIHEEPKKLDGK